MDAAETMTDTPPASAPTPGPAASPTATRPAAARPARKPSPSPFYFGALAVFLTVLIALALQMRAGADPKVQSVAAADQQPRKRVLVRRIERKVIVTTVKPAPRDAAPAPAAPAPAPVAAPVSAPAPSAPAPVAAAPQPAPVVTRSS